MDRRTGLLWLVGVLFAVAVVAAAVTDPEVTRVPVPQLEYDDAPGAEPQQPEPQQPERQERDSDGDQPPAAESGADGFDGAGLGCLAGLGLLVLLTIGLIVMWRTVRGRVTLRVTPANEPDAVRKERVREAVAASLDELAADDTDPRVAVIGCWLRLERAAAEAGTRRQPSDTPGDLVARMLAGHQVSQPVLDRLASVYRRARYAPHEIGGAMRDEARTALRQVHAQFSAVVRDDATRSATVPAEGVRQ